MISTQHARIISLLIGLALFPTLIHTYLGLTETDGLVTSAIKPSLAALHSEPTGRSPESIKENFDSKDWINLRYKQGGGKGLQLFVARSYDHKRLYHHPENRLLQGLSLDNLGTQRVESAPDIPIHLLKSANETGHHLIVYSLLYDDRFIDKPFHFLIRNALSSLFHRRKPMTLFFVHDSVAMGVPLSESRAVRLLLEAIEDFRSQQSFPAT